MKQCQVPGTTPPPPASPCPFCLLSMPSLRLLQGLGPAAGPVGLLKVRQEDKWCPGNRKGHLVLGPSAWAMAQRAGKGGLGLRQLEGWCHRPSGLSLLLLWWCCFLAEPFLYSDYLDMCFVSRTSSADLLLCVCGTFLPKESQLVTSLEQAPCKTLHFWCLWHNRDQKEIVSAHSI